MSNTNWLVTLIFLLVLNLGFLAAGTNNLITIPAIVIVSIAIGVRLKPND